MDAVNALLVMGTWFRYTISDTLLTKVLMDCCVIYFSIMCTHWVLCCAFICVVGCTKAFSTKECTLNWSLYIKGFKAADISKHHNRLLKQPMHDFPICIIYFNHSFCLCVVFIVLYQNPFWCTQDHDIIKNLVIL